MENTLFDCQAVTHQDQHVTRKGLTAALLGLIVAILLFSIDGHLSAKQTENGTHKVHWQADFGAIRPHTGAAFILNAKSPQNVTASAA